MDGQQTAEKPKKRFYKRWWFWVGAIIVVFIIIGASSGKSTPQQSVPAASDKPATAQASQTTQQNNNPAPSQSAQAASAPPATPAVMQTLLDVSGSGTKSTQKFTAGGDWDLNWSYDCSNFGAQGNFQVMIYDGSGSLSFSNAMVNQLGKSGSDVEHYHNSGTYYLEVNSECKWHVTVKG